MGFSGGGFRVMSLMFVIMPQPKCCSGRWCEEPLRPRAQSAPSRAVRRHPMTTGMPRGRSPQRRAEEARVGQDHPCSRPRPTYDSRRDAPLMMSEAALAASRSVLVLK